MTACVPQAIDPVCGAPLCAWDRRWDVSSGPDVYHFYSEACSRRFSAEERAGGRSSAAASIPRARAMIPIWGLACGGGRAQSIERALVCRPGVLRAYVNPATEMAYVEYRADMVAVDRIVAAIEALGYRVGSVEQ